MVSFLQRIDATMILKKYWGNQVMKKRIVSLLLGVIMCISLIGCSSEDTEINEESNTEVIELTTSKYLTDEGKEAVENFKKNNEYKVVDSIEYSTPTELKDETIQLTGEVSSLTYDEKTVEMFLDVEDNNTVYPIRVYLPAIGVDVEIKDGDKISVSGRLSGIKNIGETEVIHISGHFIEKIK